MMAQEKRRRADRLHELPYRAKVRTNLTTPEGVRVKLDPDKGAYVIVTKAGDIIAERPIGLVEGWKRPGVTMSFVVRYELRRRNLHAKGA